MRKFDLKILLILSVGHLSTDFYQGALPAILPFLKEKLNLSYSSAGIIMLASNLTSSVIQPAFGFISDREQKPLFLPAGCLLAGVGFSLLSIPSSYVFVLALVMLSGLGVASYHPEGFRTACLYTGQRPVTGMSIFSVGGNIGFALGPIVALWIVTHFGFPFLPIIIVPSLIFLVAIISFWKALVVPQASVSKAKTRGVPKDAAIPLVLLVSTVVVRSWIHAGLMTYIPFYYIDYLKEAPVYAGQLVSIFLLGGVCGTLAGAPLADRWGHKRYLVVSMALSSVLLPLIFAMRGHGSLLILIGIFGMVLVSTFTVTIVMAQRLLPGNLGVASGLMVGFAIGTGGVGVTILGVVADHLGLPFAVKSLVILPFIGLLLSLFLKHPSGQTTSA